jgi:hypothetical protein
MENKVKKENRETLVFKELLVNKENKVTLVKEVFRV